MLGKQIYFVPWIFWEFGGKVILNFLENNLYPICMLILACLTMLSVCGSVRTVVKADFKRW